MDPVKLITGILKTEPEWDVHVFTQSQVGDELVPIAVGEGLLKCVDGRASNKGGNAMRGPKMLGGVYAIASMRGATTIEKLQEVVTEVHGLDTYVPSVHGDHKSGSKGCGYFKLWSEKKLPDLEEPKFAGKEGMQTLQEFGGEYEVLKGAHSESHVVINLVPGHTVEPDHLNQKFIVDGWVLDEFKLDVEQYVKLAKSTVEQLSDTCRSARIIIPDPTTKVEG